MASVVTAMIRPAFSTCHMVAGVGLTSTVFYYLGSEQEKDKYRRGKPPTPAPSVPFIRPKQHQKYTRSRPPFAFK